MLRSRCRFNVPLIAIAVLTATAGRPFAAQVSPTQYRDEIYTVTRPVIETSTREERQVRYEPVTTFVPQQVDQGAWVDQQVVRPGRTITRLRWLEGGWTIDPATGREYWRLPMLRPVRIKQPDQTTTVRVWKPNVVTLSVPKISYQPRVHIQQVPVQTVRYVEERRVRRVPVGCGPLGRMIPPTAAAACPTFSVPGASTLPQVIDRPSPPANAPAPLPVLPRPEIDPRENVPDPQRVPENQPSDDRAPTSSDGPTLQ